MSPFAPHLVFSTANLPFHCQQHWVISAKTRTDASFPDFLINSGWRVSWNLAQRSSFLLKLVPPRCGSPFLEVRRYLPDTSHASCRRYSVLHPPPAVARFFRSLAARQGRCQPHFSVLDWDFSKLFELNEMVIQQKMRWVLQLDMNLMAKSPCLIEFNIYKDQKRCEYTSKCLVHARQDFRFVHPDDYASKPNFSQSGCPNPTLPHRVAIFTLSTWVTWLNKFQFEQSTQIFDSNLSVTFVWVNKKIIKKKLKPSTIWSPHQFPFKPTSSYIQPCHSIQVALSGSDPKLKQRDLPWFQPWTKPTTRSGFKLDHIRPANDMEWQQHQTTSSSSSSSSSSSNNIIIIILPIMDL